MSELDCQSVAEIPLQQRLQTLFFFKKYNMHYIHIKNTRISCISIRQQTFSTTECVDTSKKEKIIPVRPMQL